MDDFQKTLINFRDMLEHTQRGCELLLENKLTQLKDVEKEIKNLVSIAQRMDEDKQDNVRNKINNMKIKIDKDKKTIDKIDKKIKDYY